MKRWLFSGIITVVMLIATIGCSNQNPVTNSDESIQITSPTHLKIAAAGSFYWINFMDYDTNSTIPDLFDQNSNQYPWKVKIFNGVHQYAGSRNVIAVWENYEPDVDMPKSFNCHVQAYVYPTSYSQVTPGACCGLRKDEDYSCYYMAVLHDHKVKLYKSYYGTVTKLAQANVPYQLNKSYAVTVSRENNWTITATCFSMSGDVVGLQAIKEDMQQTPWTGLPGIKAPNGTALSYVDYIGYVILD